MITKGIKSGHQIQFQDENGVPAVPVINSQGAMKADLSSLPTGELGGVLIEIADGEKIDVNKTTTTLSANVVTVGTVESTVEVTGKVSQIGIANFSETATITVKVTGAGYEKSFVIGSRLAVDLPINKELTQVAITSTEEETKVQYVIKGVESEG